MIAQEEAFKDLYPYFKRFIKCVKDANDLFSA